MPQRPNILFFFTDDQRFDTIRALGNHEIATPNIDSLVERGTAFTNANIMGGAVSAICMPSRAMLMTGRTLFHLQDRGQDFPSDHITLGETLQRAGYNCWGTGKWHNTTGAFARTFNDGAEIFFGGMDDHWNVPANDYDPTGRYESSIQQIVDFPAQTVTEKTADHITAGKHSSELFCDAAIDHLRGYDDEKPFFMYVAFMAPHDPRTMPQEYLSMYDPDDIELPESFAPEHPIDTGNLRGRDEMLAGFPRTPAEIRRHIAAYYAMITHLDAQIGRVLQALEETGHADDTIIVFAGDNGLAVGQHGLLGKQNLYDHSVRVPLIMAGPGIPRNERRNAFAYLLDIYPTLCDLLEVQIPDSVEGKSLLPVLADPEAHIRDHLLYAHRQFQRGVRDHRYKLIEYVVEGNRATQLFDLHDDPMELTNLADDPEFAGHLQRLRQLLVRWRDELGDDGTPHEPTGAFWEGYGRQ